MSNVVNDLRIYLAGAVNLHPAVNVRAVAVYTIEQAIAEIERVRVERDAIRAKTIEECLALLPEETPAYVCAAIRDLAKK